MYLCLLGIKYQSINQSIPWSHGIISPGTDFIIPEYFSFITRMMANTKQGITNMTYILLYSFHYDINNICIIYMF